MPLSPSPPHLFLFTVLLFASYYDIRRSEIPRWLNILVLVSFLVYTAFAVMKNIWFVLYSLYAFFLPYMLWRLGILGGGDAKLLAMSGLFLAVPSSLSPALPPLLISLSYILYFIVPNLELLKMCWTWLIPLMVLVGVLAQGFLVPTVILMLFYMKAAELSVTGYAESIPVEALETHHMVREALKRGEVVELSDIELFLMRRDYDYVPPLRLDGKDVEKIKKLWRDNGREEVKVARERPAIPAILVASVLYPIIFGLG